MPNAVRACVRGPLTWTTAWRLRLRISLSGDDGLSMLSGAQLSGQQVGLPIKIVLLNNGIPGFVAMEMKAGRHVETGRNLGASHFADIAKGAGIFSVSAYRAWSGQHDGASTMRQRGGWPSLRVRPQHANGPDRRNDVTGGCRQQKTPPDKPLRGFGGYWV
ncbi:thiamine pyrophosphate-dependent enzyme [Paraburkholderia dinghuensis]|uniref:Thiamine pyrophosphate enzyme TPP-binding domain-containing protein n=1 Tax=Paraburkholderia dinghuensis TaxID=2305225 RepID=A0A3N6NF76_9BURK|nr:thiamine pyrophosphate-dependent enzyme [Paraburkholderia dinghuensis]RQH10131.1 hypothetical protein D1Y85_01530 [Paraburkholderia dinghuensis]